jgi:hypothetical protein
VQVKGETLLRKEGRNERNERNERKDH